MELRRNSEREREGILSVGIEENILYIPLITNALKSLFLMSLALLPPTLTVYCCSQGVGISG